MAEPVIHYYEKSNQPEYFVPDEDEEPDTRRVHRSVDKGDSRGYLEPEDVKPGRRRVPLPNKWLWVVIFILIVVVFAVTAALIFRPTVAARGNLKPGGGWVYTRWGRPDCNEGSELLYSGIAAGSRHRDLHGGGANIICLPNDPEFVNPVAGEGESRAFIYSVEFQISHFPLLQPHHLFDVSCAVCKANGRTSHVMLPAKSICPSNDWTLEYQGYLMAERSFEPHHKSMFNCVDRDPIPIPGSGGGASASIEVESAEGASSGLINLVEAKCSISGGGLPCNTFTAGYELTCAVCTL